MVISQNGSDVQTGSRLGAVSASYAKQTSGDVILARPVVGTSYKRHDDDTDTLLVTGPLGGGNDGIGRRSEDDPNLVIAATLNSGGNSGGFRTEPGEHLVAHTLRAEGADASEDGTGRGVPMVTTFQNTGHGWWNAEDRAQAVRTPEGGGSMEANLVNASSVRRLTPTECERLQGFPDGWTCLCGVEPYTTLTCRCPDSARYRAMGNAVTVQVIEWIGRRLMAAL